MPHGLVTLKELLARVPIFVAPSATCAEVATLLVHHDATAVLVCEGGRAVGVVTKRDVLMAFYASLPAEAPVTALMTAPLHAVSANTSLRDTLAEMASRRISHLAVVDEAGAPLGVVAERELLTALDRRALAQADEARQSAVEAQRNTDALLSAVFQQSTVLLGLVAIDGRLLRINDAALELMGVPRDEVLGRPFVQGPWWSHDIAQQERLRLAITDVFLGRATRFEATHPVRDGSLAVVEFSLVPITDERGAVVAALAQGLDITRRKAVEAQLRRSEFNARQLFEASQAVMLLIDPDTGRILDANRAALEWYGYTREALLALHLHDINTLTLDEVRREMQLARDEQRSHYFFRHRLAGGAVRDVEVHSGPLERDGRTVLYSIIHDITTRRQAERQAQLFRAAVEQSPTALLITDLEARIVYANRAMEQLGGYPAAELLGRTPRLFRSGETPRVVHQELWEALLREGRWTGELRNRRRDGSQYWEKLAVITAYGPEGAPSHYIAVKEDVTAAHERQARLGRLREAVAGASLGVLVVDSDGTVREANPAFCALLGQAPEEVVGLAWRLLVPAAGGGAPVDPLGRAEVDGHWAGALPLGRGDEAPVVVQASVSAVRDASGLLVSYLVVCLPQVPPA